MAYRQEETVPEIINASGVLGGRLYVLGGFDGGRLASGERYDPETDAWEDVAPMGTRKYDHSTAVLNGKLYAVGGFSAIGKLRSCERYDPAADAWEPVPDMATARSGKPGAAVLDG